MLSRFSKYKVCVMVSWLNLLSLHKVSRVTSFFINPAVSEANMVVTCKHFEIGSGSVRSLSHLQMGPMEVDSPFIFIDKETLSFLSESISYIIKLIY